MFHPPRLAMQFVRRCEAGVEHCVELIFYQKRLNESKNLKMNSDKNLNSDHCSTWNNDNVEMKDEMKNFAIDDIVPRETILEK